ncbi:hypothetical protein [Marisediminicola sp. LYQ134]|uniref:hypothetical protein n=1 Tax=Marisediminicola sp. LYQ134 TaxID=3391061 RepID=UPI003983394A
MARHRATTAISSRPRLSAIRALLAAVVVVLIAVVIALAATGTSYALWTSSTSVDASVVSSGSTAVTIDGSTTHDLASLDLSTIGPGQSVAAPLTLQNTGTTPVAASVATTTIIAQTNALANELAVTLVPTASCTPAVTGGMTGRLVGFTTSASPVVLQPGQSMALCLKVTVDLDAPASTQNSSATFRMDVSATQVRS